MLNAAILSTLFCVNLGAMELNSTVEASKTETINVLMSDVQAYNQMAILCGVARASTDADNATIDFINKTIKISLDQFYITCCNNLSKLGEEQITQELFNAFLINQAKESVAEVVVAETVLENSELNPQN